MSNITVGTPSKGSGTAASTYNLSHNHTGDTILVFVKFGYRDNTNTPTCTYDGTNISLLTDSELHNSNQTVIFGAVNSNTGTHNVTIECISEAHQLHVGAVSLTGVDTGNPFGTCPTPYWGSSVETEITSSLNVTATAGGLVFALHGVNLGDAAWDGTLTEGANQTSLYSDLHHSLNHADVGYEEGAASVTMSMTWAGTSVGWKRIAYVAVPVNAATSGPTKSIAEYLIQGNF